MSGFWEVFYICCEWGLILAFLGLVGALILLAMTALHFKTAVINHGKRLYERPLNSVKGIAATGKGILAQEQVRVKHMAGTFQDTAGDVKETATEVKSAAQSVHPGELKVALQNVQHVFRFLGVALQFARDSAHQGSHTQV